MLNAVTYENGIYTLSNGQSVDYKTLQSMGSEVDGLTFDGKKRLVHVKLSGMITCHNNPTPLDFVGINTHSVVYFPASATKNTSNGSTTKLRASHHVVQSSYFDGSKYHVNEHNMFESFKEYSLYGKVFPFFYYGNTSFQIDAFPFAINNIRGLGKKENAVVNIFDFSNAAYTEKKGVPFTLKSTPSKSCTFLELISVYEKYMSNIFPQQIEKIKLAISGNIEPTFNLGVFTDKVTQGLNLAPIWELGVIDGRKYYGVWTLDNGIELMDIPCSATSNVIDTSLDTNLRKKLLTQGLLPESYTIDTEYNLISSVLTMREKSRAEIDLLKNQNKFYIEIPPVKGLKQNSLTFENNIGYAYSIVFPSSIETVEEDCMVFKGRAYALHGLTVVITKCKPEIKKKLKREFKKTYIAYLRNFLVKEEMSEYKYYMRYSETTQNKSLRDEHRLTAAQHRGKANEFKNMIDAQIVNYGANHNMIPRIVE